MNLTKITAYGTPGVIALGAGAIWAQSALIWVAQPSHLLPVAAITAVAATVAAKRKGKVKAEQPAPQPVAQAQEPQALPQGQPTAAEAQAYLQGIREALLAKQAEPSTPQQGKVIDLGRA